MLGALALIIIVQPGQTLSGIAASHGVSLASVERANPEISNPSLIYPGERVRITGGSSWTPSSGGSSSSSYSSPSGSSSSTRSVPDTSSGGSVYGSSSLSDIPGVPSSFAACVAYRESTNGTNPAAHGNVYEILPGSGHDVAGDSLAQQKQVFREIYDTQGPSAWSASDGC